MYKQIDSNKRKSVFFIFLFIILIIVIGYFFSQLTDLGYSGVGLAAVFAIISAVGGYYTGDKVVLFISGAKEIDPEAQDSKELYRLVENLCITAGLPVPKIYIIPDSSPNAFATGRDPKHASIALTSGLVQKLERSELEGVIAHELSHIKNYDIRLMFIIVIFVGIITLLSDWFMRISFWGGGRRKRESGGQLWTVLLLIGLILMIISPLIAKIIQLAISRKREFLADADGALLTRYPEGLALALEKISRDPTPMLRVNNAIAHLYISNPKRKKTGWTARLFSTHPPIEERITALRKMA